MRRLPALLVALAAVGAAAQEPPAPGRIESFPRAEDPAAPRSAPSDRALPRDDAAAERRARESVFDSTGRLRSQRDQLGRLPGLSADRTARSRKPAYGVGPGVRIIRRAP